MWPVGLPPMQGNHANDEAADAAGASGKEGTERRPGQLGGRTGSWRTLRRRSWLAGGRARSSLCSELIVRDKGPGTRGGFACCRRKAWLFFTVQGLRTLVQFVYNMSAEMNCCHTGT